MSRTTYYKRNREVLLKREYGKNRYHIMSNHRVSNSK